MPKLYKIYKNKKQKILTTIIYTNYKQFYYSTYKNIHQIFHSTKNHKYIKLITKLFNKKPKTNNKPKPLPTINKQSKNNTIHKKNSSKFFNINTPTNSSIYQIKNSKFKIL